MHENIFKNWLDAQKKIDPLLFESIKVTYEHFFESTSDVVKKIENTLNNAEKFIEPEIEEGFSDPDESMLDDTFDDEILDDIDDELDI